MKNKFKIQIFVVLAAVLFTGMTFATDPMVAQLTKTKLPVLEEPAIDIKTLPNGMKVYYLQDTELPVFRMDIYFEAGTVFETKAQRGWTGIFMSAWRTGGTKTRTPDQVDEELDFLSAGIDGDAGLELSNFGVTCLQKDTTKVLELYFDLLFHPAFNKDRVELIKKNIIDSIQRRNEDPMDIAIREFSQSLYGQDSPFAWKSTNETVSAVTVETLEAFYKSNIAPDRAWIAASSPLPFEDFLKLLDPYVSKWTPKLPKKQFPADLKKEWTNSVEFIQKEGNQSSIVLGHFGDKRFNPEKYKIILADEVLGGSTFGSKLGDRIRTDLGLAYSIRSNFGFDRDLGAFRIFTQTKSESTVQTVNEIKKIFSDLIVNQSISQAELDSARERILNRLVFEYDVPFNIVTMRVNYDYNGYPPNYLKYYQKQIESVTLEQINAVLKDYLFPDKLKILIVGDRSKIPNLAELGEVKELPLDLE